ncbi:hypothetical protein AST03_06850 [Staphylococcus equorum]|uniref:DUF2357 domain-containing protein n=1 Tax=Staphylococcus equorum TaxID=246432 RepID=UPI00085323B8|nr:nuclease domain-containing protein [Staphylococcus equorum]OEK79676.1 hypothetical protein AST03_06850 [Staphylococcus equorum]
MDLHSNLDIIVSNTYQEKKFNIPFKDSIKEINFEKDVQSFKEYHSMKFHHSTDNNIEKLYFNGFDIIEDSLLKFDKNGNKYLSNATLDIINYNNNEQNVLVPGFYLLTKENEKTQYAIIKIIPKDFTEDEWKFLYKSVNEYLNGLANSFINENNVKAIQNKLNNNLLDKINFINQYYIDIVNSINQLIVNPRQTIQKKYNWVSKNTQPPVDKNTLKYLSKYPSKKQYLYSYKRYINFNISENIWIKFVIEFLMKELDAIDRELFLRIEKETSKLTSKYKNEIKEARLTEYNLKEFERKNNTIKNLIIKLKQTEWYSTVDDKKYIAPPHSSLMNKNYNLFYKLYLEFNKSQLDFIFSEQILNSWKKTDELYEIWCYINIIELLRNIGYEPEKGWVFSGDIQSVLDEGTYVTMKKDNISLNIHYNSLLKYKSSETDIINPLYTGNVKNKPDIRIDIFVDDIYLKSIPMDVKYRKLKNITDKKRGALKQLLAYRDSPKSLLHLKGAKDIRKNNHTVITKVIILYPKDPHSSSNTDTLSFEHGLLFYEFGPNYIDQNLKKTLNDEINEAYEIFSDIY